MMELMQSKEHSKANKDITNSLSTLLNGGGASKSQVRRLCSPADVNEPGTSR